MSSAPAQNLLQILGAVVGALQLPATHSLRQDIQSLGEQWTLEAANSLRVAVFGPFNYGKSTLLNAILGERALPIDLIPTTGAAIRVRYGDTIQTRIRLADGREVVEAGAEVLKQFAVLDEARQMRSDVTAVEVTCPHPLLKLGVELMDLPGTNDRDAQDELVKNQLLSADLVVQVLDGRKLMTLGERENLRDWLIDRGITTVIFVVNFLNLLEPDEQRQVYTRLRFVAESFRADLPPGISNLYRVDALPALRARLKGDAAAAQTAGLPMLESALQAIATQPDFQSRSRLPRLKPIVQQAQRLLQKRIDELEATQTSSQDTKEQQKREIQQQAQTLLQSGFQADLTQFRQWLEFDHLLATYHLEASVALQAQAFSSWENGAFKTQAIAHQQSLVKWVHQACEFFERSQPESFLVTFPTIPQEISEKVTPPQPAPSPQRTTRDDLPVMTVATGLGWVLGGPVGAAILGGTSYVLNRVGSDSKSSESVRDRETMADLCRQITSEYLRHFSRLNLAALETYDAIARDRMTLPSPSVLPPLQTTIDDHQLTLLRSLFAQLNEAESSIS